MTKVTYFVITVAVVVISAYDVFPATNQAAGDTISEVMRYMGLHFPVVIYMYLGLPGHFWMGSHMLNLGPWTELRLWLWSCWLFFILSIGFWQQGYELGTWGAFLVCNLGLFGGHFLWPQV